MNIQLTKNLTKHTKVIPLKSRMRSKTKSEPWRCSLLLDSNLVLDMLDRIQEQLHKTMLVWRLLQKYYVLKPMSYHQHVLLGITVCNCGYFLMYNMHKLVSLIFWVKFQKNLLHTI